MLSYSYIDCDTIEALRIATRNRKDNKRMYTRVFNDASLCLCSDVSGKSFFEVFDANGYLVQDVNSNIDYSCLTYNISAKPITNKVKIDIIYLGCFNICWGHFITDALSKMWFLFSDDYLRIYKNKVKFAISFEYDQARNQCPDALLQLYKLLGIEQSDIIIINRAQIFQTIIIPDNSLFFYDGTRHFTDLYNDTIKRIVNAVSSKTKQKYKKIDKIYLSRTHFTSGNADFGERGLEKVFKKIGYHIIHPQDYSVEEQIAMYSSAKSFVSTAGSLGHNSVFCNPGTEVILLRKCFAIFDYQLVINQMRKLYVTYVDTHLTCFLNERPNNGPFFLYRNSNFVRFINDRYNVVVSENFSTQRYLKYMRICMMRNDMKDRNHAPIYYFDKLREELLYDSTKRKVFTLFAHILPQNVIKLISKIYFKYTR